MKLQVKPLCWKIGHNYYCGALATYLNATPHPDTDPLPLGINLYHPVCLPSSAPPLPLCPSFLNLCAGYSLHPKCASLLLLFLSSACVGLRHRRRSAVRLRAPCIQSFFFLRAMIVHKTQESWSHVGEADQ